MSRSLNWQTNKPKGPTFKTTSIIWYILMTPTFTSLQYFFNLLCYTRLFPQQQLKIFKKLASTRKTKSNKNGICTVTHLFNFQIKWAAVCEAVVRMTDCQMPGFHGELANVNRCQWRWKPKQSNIFWTDDLRFRKSNNKMCQECQKYKQGVIIPKR